MSVESLDFKELEPVLSPFTSAAIAFNSMHDELLSSALAWTQAGPAEYERYKTAQAAVDSAAHSLLMHGMKDGYLDNGENRLLIVETFKSADIERLNIYGHARSAEYDSVSDRTREWEELIVRLADSDEAWFTTRAVNQFMGHVRRDIGTLNPHSQPLSARVTRKMAENPAASIIAASGMVLAGSLALTGALKLFARNQSD